MPLSVCLRRWLQFVESYQSRPQSSTGVRHVGQLLLLLVVVLVLLLARALVRQRRMQLPTMKQQQQRF